MKYLFLPMILLSVYVSNLSAGFNPSLRTYEDLASDPWTDHVQHFAKLFKIMKVHSFLEFGLGDGTKYFLDNCDKVTSAELLGSYRYDSNKRWYDSCLRLYHSYSNWSPCLYKCSTAIDKAVALSCRDIDPVSVDPAYLNDIKVICDDIFSKDTFDVAFVDAGITVRGDIVNELFNRVDIIVAHDVFPNWNTKPNVYGWHRIITPPNYEFIYFQKGEGVAFWISKELPEVINALKQYPN